jgi:hypothetical protein
MGRCDSEAGSTPPCKSPGGAVVSWAVGKGLRTHWNQDLKAPQGTLAAEQRGTAVSDPSGRELDRNHKRATVSDPINKTTVALGSICCIQKL